MSTRFICLISWGSHKFWLRILQLLKKKLKNSGSGKITQFLGDSSQLGTRPCSGSPPGILTGFLGDGVGVVRRQKLQGWPPAAAGADLNAHPALRAPPCHRPAWGARAPAWPEDQARGGGQWGPEGLGAQEEENSEHRNAKKGAGPHATGADFL